MTEGDLYSLLLSYVYSVIFFVSERQIGFNIIDHIVSL